MRTISFFICLIFPLLLHAQVGNQVEQLYQLEKRMMWGDKKALTEIAPYLDDTTGVVEYLGWHRLEVPVNEIAQRIILENCIFTHEEIIIDTNTTYKIFRDFLEVNDKKISFSKLANAFLITPLEKRQVPFEVKEISETKREELNKTKEKLTQPDWVVFNGIDYMIERRDPYALLLIASEFYKVRNRFNRYNFNEKQYLDLLQYLMQCTVGVENEKKEISWQIEEEFYPDASLNLLIYFSKYYEKYSWDAQKNCFSNDSFSLNKVSREEILFEYLIRDNDSLAIDAFIRLSESDQSKVIPLAKQYQEKYHFDNNGALPTFPFKFLMQLPVLTEYCRNNYIDYKGSKELQTDIELLKHSMPFEERYKLENKLINTLTLDDITALEYWTIIDEGWGLTYSTGRILDIFYSNNWDKLLADKKHLDLYLKKSKLYKELGIIGVCNLYLKKFMNSSLETKTKLEKYHSDDADIRNQAELASKQDISTLQRKPTTSWEGNHDEDTPNLKEKLHRLTTHVSDSSANDKELNIILSKISYQQIAIALKGIADYPFKNKWCKYSFMQRDWGFFNVGNFDKKEIREQFLQIYSKHTEYGLYAYYLDSAGIDYKLANNSLDYDKIYEMLKYDEVTAFVGGGGGKQVNEVYSLIKLLEITFKTTLGFPKKYCNSQCTYGCRADKRAEAWMKYLQENNLLQKGHNTPISFMYMRD